MVHTLVYVSTAVEAFHAAEIETLLQTCRDNNEQLEVTGMLLYSDSHIMQALEGDQETVVGLYERIAADPRHTELTVLWQSDEPRRTFGDWSMAFHHFEAPELCDSPSYNPFLDQPVSPEAVRADPSVARQLLATFRHATDLCEGPPLHRPRRPEPAPA